MVIDIHMKKEEIMKKLVRVNRLLLGENATYEGSEGFGSDILRGLLLITAQASLSCYQGQLFQMLAET